MNKRYTGIISVQTINKTIISSRTSFEKCTKILPELMMNPDMFERTTPFSEQKLSDAKKRELNKVINDNYMENMKKISEELQQKLKEEITTNSIPRKSINELKPAAVIDERRAKEVILQAIKVPKKMDLRTLKK